MWIAFYIFLHNIHVELLATHNNANIEAGSSHTLR